MSLQFVLGNSGAGKSYTLFQHMIKEAEAHPEENYLVIVPEQFTMQTQKEFVRLSSQHAIMNIDILSFQRLAYRVFQELGGQNRPILEEVGKTLVIQRVVQERTEQLGVLGNNLKKAGTISEMKSLVSELMQYDIHPEEIDELIDKSQDKPLLVHKLKDVQVVYEGFVEYLKDRYITGEEILDVLCDKIEESRLVKNSYVVLDGFTGLTPIQNKFMRKLLKLAQKVWVTVTVDENASREKMKSPHHLFHMSEHMIKSLAQLSKEERVEIEEEWWIHPQKGSRFFDTPALEFLERNIFRFGNRQFTQEQEHIKIFAASNPQEEVQEVARRIRKLVRTQGYRYGDFGVITGDLASYGSYAKIAMEECEIPCFIDEKHSILMNPFVEFVRASMNMIAEKFSYESVFRYLRCGLSSLDIHEVDLLENYCIALGIRGWNKWKEHWIRRYRGMDDEGIEEINKIKERFLQEIQDFYEQMKGRKITVEERTRSLYEFICRCRIQEALKKKEETFRLQGEMALVKEYEQIYGIIMNLLDKIVMVLGDEKISLDEYRQILEAGFLETKVGVIPPTADQVLVGDMERTRLKDIKVLFFVGVNDTIIPKNKGTGGILSETDREYLDSQEVELAPTARESMYIQKFYLYMNLTKPSQCLQLSFTKTNNQGQAHGPAYLIASICKMFPHIKIEETCLKQIEDVEIANQAVTILLDGMSRMVKEHPTNEWKELFSWFQRSPQWQEVCMRWLNSAFMEKPKDKIGNTVARALYGTVLENSASQLEKFAACAFAHFLQYGLEISQRQEYEFRPVDMGNIMHQALEQFSKNLRKHRLTWKDLSDEKREELIDESVEEMIHDYGNTILESSARNRYMITRVKRILRRTVWALQEQLKHGKYEPEKFEISFAMEDHLDAIQFDLSEDEKIRLRGRIDRVDRYEEEEKIYVKVIDYKSGSTSMDLVAIYHGLQVQLVVYLNAAMEMEQKLHPDQTVEPAGMFYYRVKDPLAEADIDEDPNMITQKILQELKVNGLVRSEEKIIHDMDETLEAGKKSQVIPVAYNKNGSLAKNSQVASLEQFQRLSSYVNWKIKDTGRKIMDGDVEINPYQLRQRKACDFCEFKSICGFDGKIPGYHFRRLPVFSDEEIWHYLEQGKEEP